MEMVKIEIQMPKEVLTIMNRTTYEMMEDVKSTLAIDFYRTGKLAMGKCADIIGVTKEEFMRMLSRRGYSIYNWDNNDEEIGKELASINKFAKEI